MLSLCSFHSHIEMDVGLVGVGSGARKNSKIFPLAPLGHHRFILGRNPDSQFPQFFDGESPLLKTGMGQHQWAQRMMHSLK
jgi:hypothetical protein